MVSKSEVGYQNEPRGDQACDRCSMFRPPPTTPTGGAGGAGGASAGCTYVEGRISPNGWCRAYLAANEGSSAPPD